jgi:hypothetical protein
MKTIFALAAAIVIVVVTATSTAYKIQHAAKDSAQRSLL